MENLPAIIVAIGGVISAIATPLAAWFAYNQYTKNKMTDLKVEQYKKDMEAKANRRADHSGIVYGELWDVLHTLDCDRVYIVQPHPLGNEALLSVYYEVKRKGIEPMKPHIQQMPIAEVANFNRSLIENQFLYIEDVNTVEDKVAHSIFSSYGCDKAIVQKLNDRRHDWTGSIFCEFTSSAEMPSEEDAREILKKAASSIQYLLPEFIAA